MQEQMKQLTEQLACRRLPPLQSREAMMEILQREVFGYLPNVKFDCAVSDAIAVEERLCSGVAACSRVEMTIRTSAGQHTVPVTRLLQQDGKPHPLIIFANFRPAVPDWYYPVELLAEQGFHVLSFCYTDVASDDADFTNGLAPLLLPQGRQKPTDCGKIPLWAWFCIRLLEYGLSLPEVDRHNTAVVGHSRLGKTALFAGMMEPRFKFVFSNNAGCAGDALAHGSLGVLSREGVPGAPGRGESIADITQNFPYWFCENYKKYAKDGILSEFDQHFLLACMAPRFVYVSSSSLDDWADPHSQQLCCLAASPQWQALGLSGFVHQERFLQPGECLQQGHIGYHVREGRHFLSYHDWQQFINFMQLHADQN